MIETKTGGPPPAENTGCNCKTMTEHEELVSRVNRSYLRDGERDRFRLAVTSERLRMAALR